MRSSARELWGLAASPQPAVQLPGHRTARSIVESVRLEKTSELIESNHQPVTSVPGYADDELFTQELQGSAAPVLGSVILELKLYLFGSELGI